MDRSILTHNDAQEDKIVTSSALQQYNLDPDPIMPIALEEAL